MEDIRIKRVEELKNAMLMNNLSEANLDNLFELYDSMLYKTFSGEFNDIFLSNYLDDSNREELLGLVSKYNSSCFYLGEFENWVDSIEGVSLSDLDLVSTKLLDNYDYLIRLAKNGGVDTLKFLSKFSGTPMFKRGAIIALLRNSFYNDDILEEILIEMGKQDGNYKDFNDKQKIILCNYPEGVLYKVNDDKEVVITPVKELKEAIVKGLIGSKDDDYDISTTDSSSFEQAISSIYTEYYEDNLNEYNK